MTDETEPESMSGSCTGYRVEARAIVPRQIPGGQIIGTEWTQVTFEKAPTGVRPHQEHEIGLAMFYLYSYAAAQALRWWLLSEVGLYTRLAKYRVNYDGKKHAAGGCDETDARGQQVGEKT